MAGNWHLPEDLVAEILTRLPVKSLMRFKCVCKRWCALTTNPNFIAMHVNNSSNRFSGNDKSDGFLTVGYNGYYGFQDDGICNLLPLNLDDVGFESKPDLVLGPCDGIFCLYWKPYGYDMETRNHRRTGAIALCNPATREFSVLPASNFEFPPYKPVDTCNLGFGFDRKTRNYKVVKPVSFEDVDLEYWFNGAEVYTLSTGSWRVLLDAEVLLAVEINGGSSPMASDSAYTNGVFHWSFYYQKNEDEAVVSFDMTDEVFRVTRLPKRYNSFTMVAGFRRRFLNLSLLHERLVVFCCFFEEGRTSFEIWLMKEDYEFSHQLTVEPPLHGLCGPLGFWKNNHEELLLILRCHHFLSWRGPTFLYDPVTKQSRDCQLSGEVLDLLIYKESLVSVKGGNPC